MNLLEFFFGWLTKGQAEVSMFDGIMFWLEFLGVIFLWIVISTKLEDFKKRRKKDE